MKYQKIKLKGNKQKGFTLIELLMVVVILGILAYVATSAFSGSPNAANATAIRSGATEIAKGVGYIHANIGNGIKTKTNPLLASPANTMLDVLMVGNIAVSNDKTGSTKSYKDRFDMLEMRPLESEFRVSKRATATAAGEYSLLSYAVNVDDNCPVGKVCISFSDVPDAVLAEVLTRYGLDENTTGVKDVMTKDQSLPVSFTANSGKGTNTLRFALIP